MCDAIDASVPMPFFSIRLISSDSPDAGARRRATSLVLPRHRHLEQSALATHCAIDGFSATTSTTGTLIVVRRKNDCVAHRRCCCRCCRFDCVECGSAILQQCRQCAKARLPTLFSICLSGRWLLLAARAAESDQCPVVLSSSGAVCLSSRLSIPDAALSVGARPAPLKYADKH